MLFLSAEIWRFSCRIIQEPRILHFYLHIFGILLSCQSRAVIRPESNGCLGFLLSIWLIFQCFDPASGQSRDSQAVSLRYVLSFVGAALPMGHHAVFTFKPFCAFHTIELA